jgi:hypothetical protein
MNRALKALGVIALTIAVIAVGYAIGFRVLTTTPPSAHSPNPTAAPTPEPVTVNVTVSGFVICHGLTIPPTEVQFSNTETHEVYKAPVNQPGYSYRISLPVNQTYGLLGDWNGRTFNASGITMGAIVMRCENNSPLLDLHTANSAVIQNIVAGQ